MNKMKIVLHYYCVEDLNSGLFHSQVFRPLIQLKKTYPQIKVKIICVNRPFSFILNFKKSFSVFRLLKRHEIFITYIPVLPPLRYCQSSVYYTKLILNYLSLVLKIWAPENDAQINHCRGYFTAFSVCKIGLKNVVFDPRSIWPLEIKNISYSKNPNIFNFWLSIERFIIKKVDVTLAVSKWMVNYFKEIRGNVCYVPIFVDTKFFNFNGNMRNVIRKNLNWEKQKIAVYSGSLGLANHNIVSLMELFSFIVHECGYKLLVISDINKKAVSKLMEGCSLNVSDYKHYQINKDLIPSFLSASDLGLHALPPAFDSHSRLGTKVVEYWAIGLPTLINEHVGAAAQFIKDNPFLGFQYTKENEDLPKIINNSKTNHNAVRTFSARMFGNAAVSDKFYTIYKNL